MFFGSNDHLPQKKTTPSFASFSIQKLPETKRIADLIRMCMYHIQEQG